MMRCLSALLLGLTGIIPAFGQIPTFNDVVYASNVPTGGAPASLRMDIYKATNTTAASPVLLWIHGGGWQGGSYNTIPSPLVPVLARGVSIVSVQYRLSGDAIFPAQIHDVKGAVRFLRAYGNDYGLETTNIAAWGTSAGGHLASLLGTSGGVTTLEGTTGGNAAFSSRIQAVVDGFGPTDILNMNLDVTNPPGSTIDHDSPSSPESRLIGYTGVGQGIGVLRANQFNPNAPFPELMERVTNVNPITHVTSDDPKHFIFHGTNDELVPFAQSTKLQNALLAANVQSTFMPYDGGHGFYPTPVQVAAQDFVLSQLVPVPEPIGLLSVSIACLASTALSRRSRTRQHCQRA